MAHSLAALDLDAATRQEATQMRQVSLGPTPRRHKNSDTTRVRGLALAALATLALAPAASAAATTHRVKLDSSMFAAQVGSTTTGGNVYAGALPDPTLGQGAAVFTAYGTTHLRVSFHVYFALGSITGTGRVSVAPAAAGGQATFTGALRVTGGTGAYNRAHGKLTVAGTIDNTGQLLAAIRGTFTH